MQVLLKSFLLGGQERQVSAVLWQVLQVAAQGLHSAESVLANWPGWQSGRQSWLERRAVGWHC